MWFKKSKTSFNLTAIQFTGKSGMYNAGQDARLGPMTSHKHKIQFAKYLQSYVPVVLYLEFFNSIL